MIPFGSVKLVSLNPNGPVAIDAQVSWLTEMSDWRFVNQWRRALASGNSPAAHDSLEYAMLSGKRWRFLLEQRLSVSGWSSLREHLRRDQTAELGMALAVTRASRGMPAVLGFAYLRRTWANNLILEFLAASPVAGAGIKGVGAAIMQCAAAIGVWLQAPELWGECTAASRGFYRTLKVRYAPPELAKQPAWQRPESISDRFQFGQKELQCMAAAHTVKINPCPPPALEPNSRP
jgi:hypothetical protein